MTENNIFSVLLVNNQLLLTRMEGVTIDGSYVLINPLTISFNETKEGSMIFGKRFLPTILSEWDSKTYLLSAQVVSVSKAAPNYVEYYERLIEASRYPDEVEHIDIYEDDETESEEDFVTEKQEKTYH